MNSHQHPEVTTSTTDVTRSDEELLNAYKQGDTVAFEELVRRYQARIYRFLVRLIGDETLAEDATMETFFKLHRAADRYRSQSRFSPYLFTIAYREGLMVLRKLRQESGTQHGIDEARLRTRARSPLWPTGTTPEDQAEARDRLKALDRALDMLSESQRAVFLLYYREELSTTDIARVLEIPSGSVRAYLCQARKTVCNVLEHWEQPPDFKAAMRSSAAPGG